ncbi:unnamed protein product [Prorocentrum cordatum]|uniref:NADP-dependent oxidoreductase domain-containing protein n=1 Tax=Prorocentrum cordatum TaxID=2364126 RepID=A0ABN9TIG2_9DINO|nr:unnamed protein product [Polarella glacialis]
MAHHLHALMTLALLPPGASGMGLRAAHEPNADAARMPRQRLAGGGQMFWQPQPMSGIGLSAVKGTRAHDATLEFLRAGGRLLDTAEHYGNHGQVGAAIREAIKDHGVRREDVSGRLRRTLSRARNIGRRGRCSQRTVCNSEAGGGPLETFRKPESMDSSKAP